MGLVSIYHKLVNQSSYSAFPVLLHIDKEEGHSNYKMMMVNVIFAALCR